MKELLSFQDVWLIGGGGKTTLMFRLAAAWVALNESVICTTTTRILLPESHQCNDVRAGDPGSLIEDLHDAPSPLVTVVRRVEGAKCIGFDAEEAFRLRSEAQHLVVEADGAAGLPVKAHAEHEPVIAAGASCVAAVVGAWCIGGPLDARHVHRPERFSALSGRPLGAAVTADDVANVMLHEEGWLRSVPAAAAFHVVVTGADSGIRQALEAHPRAGRISGVLRLPPEQPAPGPHKSGGTSPR